MNRRNVRSISNHIDKHCFSKNLQTAKDGFGKVKNLRCLHRARVLRQN